MHRQTMNSTDLHSLLQSHLKPVNFAATEQAKFYTINLRIIFLRLQQQAAKCDLGDQIKVTKLIYKIVAGINGEKI